MRPGTVLFACAAALIVADLLSSAYAYRLGKQAELRIVGEDGRETPLERDGEALPRIAEDGRIPFGRRIEIQLADGAHIQCWRVAAWGWCDEGWHLEGER